MASFRNFEKDYAEGLSVSDDNDFQIHHKRLLNSRFVNNYLCHGIIAGTQTWAYNQFLIITNKRSESECLLAIKQAVRNAF